MTERFQAKSSASAAAFRFYGKSGSQAGKVFDFSDDTWKTLGAAVTPYVAATKITDQFGTGQHLFYYDFDLSRLNKTGAVMRYESALFASATPATTDTPDSGILEFPVTLSVLSDEPPIPKAAIVSNTLGDELEVSVWLEHRGAKVPLSTVDSAATCRVIMREHGAASGTLTVDTNSPAITWTRRDQVLEGVVEDQNFNDNVQYMLEVTLTENGNAHTADDVPSIWGS